MIINLLTRRFGATGNVTPIKTPTAKKPKVPGGFILISDN